MRHKKTKTVSIAGCCGYIGTHMTRAALRLGMRVYGIDPFMRDEFRDHPQFEDVKTVAEFCDRDSDMYYLALQPNHRTPYLDRLVPDGRPIFSEKPMSRARDPEACDALVQVLAEHPATMVYNFLLIHNPITEHMVRFLRVHRDVRITYMKALAEKNRESRRNMRNQKFMEPIQYQESIHGLSVMITLLGEVAHFHTGDFEAVFPGGVIGVGESESYDAPSSDYDAIPDGQFYGTLTGAGFRADVMTNFKRLDRSGFPTLPQKLFVVSGQADGMPFEMEADYQRGQEFLRINGEPVALAAFEPYEYVWQKVLGGGDPSRPYVPADEHLAALTYRLSATLWQASFTGDELLIDSAEKLKAVSLGYRDAFDKEQLPMYRRRPAKEWVERHMIDPVVDAVEGLRKKVKRGDPAGRPNRPG